MKLKFRFIAAMAVAAFAFVCAACNSDEPPTPPEPLTDEIRPVITDGKKWVRQEVWHYTGVEKNNDIYTTYVDGEIEIDGASAKAIKCIEDEHYNNILREEDGVVYKRWEFIVDYGTMEPEYKFMYAYDVNPQEGKTITDALSQTITIQSKGTIVLSGKTRRATMVKVDRGSDGLLYDYWVEGIGSLFNLMAYHDETQQTTWLYNWMPMYEMLLECYDGDDKIYDHTEFSPDDYTPEVVFNELEENALEVVAKMIDGSIANE